MIAALIDKQDNSELIRAQIASILALESASQMALATAGGKDPDLWKLRVYEERATIWQALGENEGTSPIVNVWFDSETFDGMSGNTVERQKASGTFNIDIYGYGRSSDSALGHTPGDLAAALAAQRAMRLCRNILMAAEYTYLGLRTLVWRRWPESISMFQPQQDNQNHSHVVGARLALRVDFNEFSPQVPGEELEYLSVQVLRDEDGLLLVQADYDYTATP